MCFLFVAFIFFINIRYLKTSKSTNLRIQLNNTVNNLYKHCHFDKITKNIQENLETIKNHYYNLQHNNKILDQKSNNFSKPQIFMSTSTSQKTPERKQLHIFFASTTTCIINMIVINPLQVKKLRLQYSPVTCPQWPHLTFRDLNNCQCTRFQVRDFFKGLSVSLFHALLSNTFYMQLYQFQRKKFVQYLPSSMATLSAALFSRVMVTFVMNPIQAFRVRFTNSTQKTKIKQSNSSLRVTLARDIAYSCLYWLSVQKIRNMLMGQQYRSNKSKKSLLYANVIPAAISGSVISAITTPLDTIKTRLQSGVEIQGTLWQQIKKLYNKQGLIGLFSGVQYRVIRNTLSSIIYLTLFEGIITELEKYENNKLISSDNKLF